MDVAIWDMYLIRWPVSYNLPYHMWLRHWILGFPSREYAYRFFFFFLWRLTYSWLQIHMWQFFPCPSWLLHCRLGTYRMSCLLSASIRLNTVTPRQNARHFADDIFKCIFLNENVWISIIISLKFVPRGQINNIQALVRGDKPLS